MLSGYLECSLFLKQFLARLKIVKEYVGTHFISLNWKITTNILDSRYNYEELHSTYIVIFYIQMRKCMLETEFLNVQILLSPQN